MNSSVEATARLFKLVSAYNAAKKAVIRKGYSWEIEWQNFVTIDEITEPEILGEAAWVVLSSGMREAVIRKKFPAISEAFFKWESAQKIVVHRNRCRKAALRHFNNKRKIEAIIKIAHQVFTMGFHSFKESIKEKGIPYIMRLPFMGPATSYHFAKNIGLSVVKPDRHLLRVAKVAGYSTPHDLCLEIAEETEEDISVVDLVIWRYATLFNDYLELFSPNVPIGKLSTDVLSAENRNQP